MSSSRDAIFMGNKPLELNRYFPFYIGAIANKWTSSSSRIYLRQFGIGIVEWRILVSLQAYGSATSLDIANLVGSDPAAISRGIRNLESRALVVPVNGRFPGRTKPYELTPGGQEMFKTVEKVTLAREQILLQDLSAEEREQLLVLLRKLHGRLSDLQPEE
jgi:DNA-binding MarR family transcriptional regulator